MWKNSTHPIHSATDAADGKKRLENEQKVFHRKRNERKKVKRK